MRYYANVPAVTKPRETLNALASEIGMTGFARAIVWLVDAHEILERDEWSEVRAALTTAANSLRVSMKHRRGDPRDALHCFAQCDPRKKLKAIAKRALCKPTLAEGIQQCVFVAHVLLEENWKKHITSALIREVQALRNYRQAAIRPPQEEANQDSPTRSEQGEESNTTELDCDQSESHSEHSSSSQETSQTPLSDHGGQETAPPQLS